MEPTRAFLVVPLMLLIAAGVLACRGISANSAHITLETPETVLTNADTTELEAAEDSSPRKYVLDQDEANIADGIVYDMVISNEDVPCVFQEDGGPETRALIVSNQLLEIVTAPTMSFDGPDGSPEYYVLMNVLWQRHVLVGLDSTSGLIAEKLALAGVPAPFDPLDRAMPASPGTPNSLLAATILHFTIDDGWTQVAVSSTKKKGVTQPPYLFVDRHVNDLLQ